MDSFELRRMLHGYQFTRIITTCAELGLADILKSGPKSATEIAPVAGVDRSHLVRLLRAAIVLDLFEEPTREVFANNPLSEYLRSDHPEGLRNVAICFAQPWVWQSWGALTDVVRTGRTGMDLVYRQSFFEYLSTHAEAQQIFSAVMGSGRQGDDEIAECFDFSKVEAIYDVGGARGSLLCAIAERFPSIHGAVFDLPSVEADARKQIGQRGLTDRVSFIPGDFFQSIPVGADLLILRYILHDWSDDMCRLILSCCAKALPRGGKLLLVESLVPERREDAARARLLDITMMTQTGGRERTELEYRNLLEEAGFDVKQIYPLKSFSGMAIVETVVGR